MELISFLAGAGVTLGSFLVFMLFLKAMNLVLVPAPQKQNFASIKLNKEKIAEVAAQNPGLADELVQRARALLEEEDREHEKKAQKDLDKMTEEASTFVRGLRTEIEDPLAKALEEVI